MSGARTTVDPTDAERWESERNRVAWNLPPGRPAAPNPSHEAAKEKRPLPDSTDEVTESG